MDGVYGFSYCGDTGWGFGFLKVTPGAHSGVWAVNGADWAGGRYIGEIRPVAGSNQLELTLDMVVQPNIPLVQGTSAQQLAMTKSLTTRLPADFATGAPFSMYVPPANVWLMMRRVPDGDPRYENYASNGFTLK
jgi:hypothetical protein